MHLAVKIAGVVGTLACGAGFAVADVVITPVILTGQIAPGTGGTFSSFYLPACKAAGGFALTLSVDFSPIAPGSGGPWSATPSGLHVMAMVDGPAPGGAGSTWAYTSLPLQNRRGASFFSGVAGGGALGDAFMYWAEGEPPRAVLRGGDPIQNLITGSFGFLLRYHMGGVAMNDDGLIAFYEVASPTGRQFVAVVDAMSGAHAVKAAQYITASPTNGQVFDQLGSPGINSRGDIAFWALLEQSQHAGFYWSPAGGSLETVLEFGQIAPGFPQGYTIGIPVRNTPNFYGYSGPPAFNDHGVFAVSAGAWLQPWSGTVQGLWRGRPGELTLVARSGDPAVDGGSGATLVDFIPLINRAGVVCSQSRAVSSAGGAKGIWTFGVDGQPRLVAVSQMPAPEMAGWTFAFNGAWKFSFNNRGEALVLTTVRHSVSGALATGLFAGRAGRVRKVVATGDVLEITPGEFRTVYSVNCWTGTGPDMGREISINDRGEVAFMCTFEGGGGGVFLAQLPHPCPGDANCDDRVDFLDLNHVLGDFGRSGPEFIDGDVNSDGTVDFLDLNSVLSTFGSAC